MFLESNEIRFVQHPHYEGVNAAAIKIHDPLNVNSLCTLAIGSLHIWLMILQSAAPQLRAHITRWPRAIEKSFFRTVHTHTQVRVVRAVQSARRLEPEIEPAH